jgi:hypothetical protein
MNHNLKLQTIKEIYHRMPAKFRKHGDMPTLVDMDSDVEAFMMSDEYVPVLHD